MEYLANFLRRSDVDLHGLQEQLAVLSHPVDDLRASRMAVSSRYAASLADMRHRANMTEVSTILDDTNASVSRKRRRTLDPGGGRDMDASEHHTREDSKVSLHHEGRGQGALSFTEPLSLKPASNPPNLPPEFAFFHALPPPWNSTPGPQTTSACDFMKLLNARCCRSSLAASSTKSSGEAPSARAGSKTRPLRPSGWR